MAVGAVNNQIAPNPAVNLDHEALMRNLEAIKTKNVGDNLWFGLDAEGDFVLHPRPVPSENIFFRIWECITRVFECIVCWATGERPPLEQQFVWISDQVEEHLNALYLARNERVLGNFLNTYTTAINELYQAATKMEQAGIISHETLAHLNGKEKIRDYMITEINPNRLAHAGEREYHPYMRPVQLRVENELLHSTVSFRTPGLRMQERLEARTFQSGQHESSIFTSDDQPLNLSADVTVKRVIDAQGGSCDIYFGGEKIRKKTNNMSDSATTFVMHNESNKNMRIALTGCDPREGRILAPKKDIKIPLHQTLRTKEVEITSIYTLESQFTFGCKLARYRAVVGEEGGLRIYISPLHVTEVFPPQDFLVDEQHPWQVAGAEYPRLMKYRVRRIDGTYFEDNMLIPIGQPVQRAYRDLCGQAGVDLDARARLHVQVNLSKLEWIIPRQQQA